MTAHRIIGWLPVLVALAVAMTYRFVMPAWSFMWSLALALYIGFKWLTWWRARMRGMDFSPARAASYLCAWPGMDPTPFAQRRARVILPRPCEWYAALGKVLLGATLLWGIARMVPSVHPRFVGWVGMIGLIFLLHFGFFHLAALFWRVRGIDTQHIFHAPARATSLGEFWGERWNLGFRQLTHQLVFQPLRSRIGIVGAVLAAFLVSGVMHDLVISLPAQGGYGLPTVYFLVQGCAVCFEHTTVARRLGLGEGFMGWLFVLICAGAPAYFLFHPPFVLHVIVPFMEAIGAL